MKNLFKFTISLVLLTSGASAEVCQTTTKEVPMEEAVVSTTDVPKELKNALITVRTRDGKEYEFSIEHYKVVPRNRITVTTKVKVLTSQICEAVEKKNNLSVGVRQGHVNLTKSFQPGSVTLKSVRGPIFDVEYYRRNVLSSVGFGAGIDSNGDPKIKIGGDF